MELDDFCSDVVPEFTPLGGNRPDCAVVMAAAISLLADSGRQSSPSQFLPPDVLDTAMATVCATVIIRSVSDVIEPSGRVGSRRLLCRLDIVSNAVLSDFCNRRPNICSRSNVFEVDSMPWRNFERVCLQIALPDSIVLCGDALLATCRSLTTVDLRQTALQTLGDSFCRNCTGVTQVHLPETLQTVGWGFLSQCNSLVSIDLRHTKLQTVGHDFMRCCESLRGVHLPDTLRTVGGGFLARCNSLVSIDLRCTKLHKAGNHFLYSCESLLVVQLPDTLSSIGRAFLGNSTDKHNCLPSPSPEEVASIQRTIIKERAASNKRNRFFVDVKWSTLPTRFKCYFL